MTILTEEEMAARLDFRRPLHPTPEPKETIWCIPFEFGPGEKGTRISISKAKEIAAELRASVAEAEKRELYRAFKAEEERCVHLSQQFSKANDEKFAALSELVILKQKLRRTKRKGSRVKST